MFFPQGMKADNYLQNPVVMYGHDYQSYWSTIGRTNELAVSDDGIEANFDLRPAANEHDPQNVILLLWDGDWVRGASIGFIPDFSALTDNDLGGVDFNAWELLEWSLVPIPANQDALRLAYAAKTGVADIQDITAILKAGDLSPESIAKLIAADKAPKVYQIPLDITDTKDHTTRIFTAFEIAKAQEDAPNYREAEGDSRCGNCRFFEDGLCTRFDFSPNSGWVCDDYQPQPEETNDAGMLAWVRQLDLEDGQTVLATFYDERIDIPEDAEKMTINEYGEIEFVPHPDAGTTVQYRNVNYAPPIEIEDGYDAIYSVSWREQTDDNEMVQSEGDYTVKALSDILLSLPLNQEPQTRNYKATLDVCKLTAKSRRVVGKILKRAQIKAEEKEADLDEITELVLDLSTQVVDEILEEL